MLQAIAGHDPKRSGKRGRAECLDYRAALTGGIQGLLISVLLFIYSSRTHRYRWWRRRHWRRHSRTARVRRRAGGRVRIRPAQVYHGVKITGAESELHAVHEPALAQAVAAGDSGRIVLAGRWLHC